MVIVTLPSMPQTKVEVYEKIGIIKVEVKF